MRTTANLDQDRKTIFFIYMLQFAGTIVLKIIVGIAAYFFITRHTSFDVRQLVAVVIAMTVAGKVSVKIKT